VRLTFQLALRNVLRNRRRSLLTIVTVVLGTALLTLGLSWINGVLSEILGNATAMSGEVRVVTPEYQRREALRPLSENMEVTDFLVEAIESIEGLEAYPLLRSGVILTVGEEIGDDYGLLVGASQAYFDDVLGLGERLVLGEPLTGAPGEALIGRKVAEDVGARPGDTLVVLGQTQDGSMSPLQVDVVGVVDGGNPQADRQVYVPLAEARYLADIPEGATEILVFGAGLKGSEATSAALAALPALEGLVVESWDEREPYRSLTPTLRIIFGFLAGIIVFVTALGVLNTMIMAVLERTAEIGVMRAMGLSRRGAVSQFLVEGGLIGVLGSSLGLALGTVPARWLETHGINLGEGVTSKVAIPISSTVHADLTLGIAIVALLLGTLTAVIGALIPALYASRIQPVDAMRRKK